MFRNDIWTHMVRPRYHRITIAQCWDVQISCSHISPVMDIVISWYRVCPLSLIRISCYRDIVISCSPRSLIWISSISWYRVHPSPWVGYRDIVISWYRDVVFHPVPDLDIVISWYLDILFTPIPDLNIVIDRDVVRAWYRIPACPWLGYRVISCSLLSLIWITWYRDIVFTFVACSRYRDIVLSCHIVLSCSPHLKQKLFATTMFLNHVFEFMCYPAGGNKSRLSDFWRPRGREKICFARIWASWACQKN